MTRGYPLFRALPRRPLSKFEDAHDCDLHDEFLVFGTLFLKTRSASMLAQEKTWLSIWCLSSQTSLEEKCKSYCCSMIFRLGDSMDDIDREMALVLSPWFGRGCGRRARFSCGMSPSVFTDLVILKVPLQRQACAPVQGSPAISNVRVLQWAETAEAHIFKLRLPGIKKEDLHIQIEDDRTIYISHSESKVDSKDGESSTNSQKFMRKFKLPENSDLEQIKADVTNDTLTVTVPKLKMKAPEPRIIDVSDGGAAATSSTTPSTDAGKTAEKSEPPSSSSQVLRPPSA